MVKTPVAGVHYLRFFSFKEVDEYEVYVFW